VIQDLEGHTKITVVDDEETTFEMSKTTPPKTLDAPYSCQGGN
jgi:hypothetical protein